MRRPRKQPRTYRFRTDRHLWLRRTFVLCVAALIVSLWQASRYALQYVRTVRISAELEETYLSADDKMSLPTVQQYAVVPTTQSEIPTTEPPPTDTPFGTINPLGTLPPQTYPQNPYRLISERFLKLRRQNEDIVGWLNIDDLISEAVVQRDNTYYLRRDYRGYHNDNGAIFLDEACSLRMRPYTLILYGHNMKSGAMFGSLRNYEDIGFYRRNPFVNFDTIYEDGRYVIFSVASVSTDVRSSRYSGFYRLDTCTNLEREAIIRRLCELSEHTCTVDVNMDDQLLLLVTCVGDDDERRIVAARRIRVDETEHELYRSVQLSQKR